MLTDPYTMFELGVITVPVIFLGWILSPRQRSRRRRQAARDRIAIRRAVAVRTTNDLDRATSHFGREEIGRR
jgi:hypothetical protein